MTITYNSLYVMRSSKMSLSSNKMKIQFSKAMGASHFELYFGENLIIIDLMFSGIQPFLKQSNAKEIEQYYCLYLKINIKSPDSLCVIISHILILV